MKLPVIARIAADPPRRKTLPRLISWFAGIAGHLLNETDLVIAGRRHRLAEVEAYYFHPRFHPDPFTHRHPIQRESGRWYFHRVGTAYRGGSFKGVDLTLGDGEATFGILIRSIVTPAGEIIVGPSRIVDDLLRQTGTASVSSLDAEIGDRTAWDESSPLAILPADPPRSDAVLATARVGLSLRRHRNAEAVSFLLRPYRFLTEPRRITKGRPQTVLALHQLGKDRADIRAITGAPLATIDRYLRSFEAGRSEASFEPYFGKDLTPEDLCRLIGFGSTRP